MSGINGVLERVDSSPRPMSESAHVSGCSGGIRQHESTTLESLDGKSVGTAARIPGQRARDSHDGIYWGWMGVDARYSSFSFKPESDV